MTDRNAATLAGYGPQDTPMEPRRSAYTDDDAGTLAYGRAIGRWVAYQALSGPAIIVDTDPTPPHGIERRNPFHFGEGACSNPDHAELECHT